MPLVGPKHGTGLLKLLEKNKVGAGAVARWAATLATKPGNLSSAHRIYVQVEARD